MTTTTTTPPPPPPTPTPARRNRRAARAAGGAAWQGACRPRRARPPAGAARSDHGGDGTAGPRVVLCKHAMEHNGGCNTCTLPFGHAGRTAGGGSAERRARRLRPMTRLSRGGLLPAEAAAAEEEEDDDEDDADDDDDDDEGEAEGHAEGHEEEWLPRPTTERFPGEHALVNRAIELTRADIASKSALVAAGSGRKRFRRTRGSQSPLPPGWTVR